MDVTSENPIAVVQHLVLAGSDPTSPSRASTTHANRYPHSQSQAGEQNGDRDRDRDRDRDSSFDSDDSFVDGTGASTPALINTTRVWLETLIREMMPRTKSGAIDHDNTTAISVMAASLQSMLHTNKSPLPVKPLSPSLLAHGVDYSHSQAHNHNYHDYDSSLWNDFAIAAGAMVASHLRGDGVLFYPPNGGAGSGQKGGAWKGQGQGDSESSLWGVATRWNADETITAGKFTRGLQGVKGFTRGKAKAKVRCLV